MADPASRPSQPPWKHSAAIGDYYVYNPTTDKITLSNGSCFLRPQHMQIPALMNAAWDGPLQLATGPAQSNTGGRQPLAGRQGGQNPGTQVRGGAQAPTRTAEVEPTSYPNGRYPSTYQQPYSQRPVQQWPAQQRSAQPGNPTSYPGQPHQAPIIQDFVRRTDGLSINPSTRQAQGHGIDPGMHADTLVRRGHPDHMTPPDLRIEGITVRQHVESTGVSPTSTLDPSYIVRRPSFYMVGRVFVVLWTEPAGNNATQVTKGTVRNHLGELVFSKIRRFVVIREGRGYCSALPIATYSGQGVGKYGVVKSDHAIIYTGKTVPQPMQSELPSRREAGMRPVPIRVDPDTRDDRLDPVSRVDLRAVHTVHHNIKAKNLGCVNTQSLGHLQAMFQNVWAIPNVVRRSGPQIQGRQPAIVEEDANEENASGNEESGEEDNDEDSVQAD